MNTYIALIVLFFSLNSAAHYTTHDTGDLLKSDQYEFTVNAAFLTNPNSGTQITATVDSGLYHDSNVRALLSVGAIDYAVGGFYKWVPVPDYGKQPAMGLLGGALYASDGDIDELSIRLHPFVSKKFSLVFGDANAYASLPVGIRFLDGTNDVPIQLAVGSELKIPEFNQVNFTAEIGINLQRTYSYFSLGVVFFLDDNKDYKFE